MICRQAYANIYLLKIMRNDIQTVVVCRYLKGQDVEEIQQILKKYLKDEPGDGCQESGEHVQPENSRVQ